MSLQESRLSIECFLRYKIQILRNEETAVVNDGCMSGADQHVMLLYVNALVVD